MNSDISNILIALAKEQLIYSFNNNKEIRPVACKNLENETYNSTYDTTNRSCGNLTIVTI